MGVDLVQKVLLALGVHRVTRVKIELPRVAGLPTQLMRQTGYELCSRRNTVRQISVVAGAKGLDC